MRQSISYILMAVLLLAGVGQASAQTRRQKHDSQRDFLYLSASLAGQSLLSDQPVMQGKGGSSITLGAGFRGYYNHFIYSLGAEGRYGSYVMGVPGMTSDVSGLTDFDGHYGLPGEPYTLHATVGERTEYMHAAQVDVPLLFGGEWGRLYLMAGAKASIAFYGSAKSQALVSTTASYDRYDMVFHDMPNHGLYSNQPILSAREKIAFRPQVLAVGEIGVRLGEVYSATGADIPKSKMRCYLAAFTEVGVLNMHKALGSADALRMELDKDNQLTCSINPALNAQQYADAKIRNFVVGLKLTVAFELPKPRVCVVCKETPARQANRF